MSKLPKEYKEWRPLPDYLTIKESKINGIGLFATKLIPKFTEIGVSHYELYDLFIRTPLGGFINHSNQPNCNTVKNHNYTHSLVTLEVIMPDTELTLNYSLASCFEAACK